MPDINRIVYEVLSQIGNHREARYYFDLFNHDEPTRFALIVVESALMGDSIEDLSAALSLLYHLGLMPVVLHDCHQQGNRLKQQLEVKGVRVENITLGVNRSDQIKDDIQTITVRQLMPLVSFEKDVGLFAVLKQLAQLLQPQKLIVLSKQGGLFSHHGNIISSINLNSDLVSADTVNSNVGCQLLNLDQAKQILTSLPAETSISITTVKNLAKELFTYQGAGTLIRIEEQINRFTRFEGSLVAVFKQLVVASFSRQLDPRYFAEIPLDKLFISESQRAAAVVIRNDAGLPYLDKFVVTPEAQGIGLGKVVWQKLMAEYGQLYWRARVNNPINSWYLRQADRSRREGEWLVFGQNIAAENWPDCISDALAREVYFKT